MEKLISFIDIIAWISFSLSTLLIVGRIWAEAQYSELEKALNAMQGIHVTFPLKVPFLIFIISTAWLAS